LKVEHVIVCGHYGCGGVQAVIEKREVGLANNWLRHLADVAERHAAELASLPNDVERGRRLCELNIVDQVRNVCESTIVLNAWKEERGLLVHGWVYGLQDGLLRDLLKTPVASVRDSLKL
jgi:carbonic anhydrase